jgi:hypothetical protein
MEPEGSLPYSQEPENVPHHNQPKSIYSHAQFPYDLDFYATSYIVILSGHLESRKSQWY